MATPGVDLIESITDKANSPEATHATNGNRRYVRVVQVETKVVLAGPFELLRAIGEVEPGLIEGAGYAMDTVIHPPGTGTLPEETLDANPFATCVSLEPRRDQKERTRWEVRATYETQANGDNRFFQAQQSASGADGNFFFGIDVGDWLTEEPLVEIDFVSFQEDVIKAQLASTANADPELWVVNDFGAVINSAGDPMLEPAPRRDVERVSIVVERNLLNMTPAIMKSLFLVYNSVNTKNFRVVSDRLDYTILAYHGRMKSIQITPALRGGTRHYRVRYEIDVFDNTASASAFDRSWIQQFMDRGFTSLSADATQGAFDITVGERPQFQQSLFDSGNQQQEGLLKDGEPFVLPTKSFEGATVWDDEAVEFREYLLYDKADWQTEVITLNFPNNGDTAPIPPP